MRIGINPEKGRARELVYRKHRIIIPVHIPDDNHEYYKDAMAVFKKCLISLLESIDPNETAISILNNSSSQEVTAYIRELLILKTIDKHVEYAENKGKVYAVLQEARGSYEELVTICDSDVLLFPNWQNEVVSVFSTFKNIGVVGITPDANLAFYCNNSLFSKHFLSVKAGKIVSDQDFELFERGINNKDIFIGKDRNWKQKQYYLDNGSKKVIVGAGHFASTYRTTLFRNIQFKKPVLVFPGGEYTFIDEPIDKLGYFRVSLSKAYAYHMGNSVLNVPKCKNCEGKPILNGNTINEESNQNVIPYMVKKLIVRIFKRFFYNKSTRNE